MHLRKPTKLQGLAEWIAEQIKQASGDGLCSCDLRGAVGHIVSYSVWKHRAVCLEPSFGAPPSTRAGNVHSAADDNRSSAATNVFPLRFSSHHTRNMETSCDQESKIHCPPRPAASRGPMDSLGTPADGALRVGRKRPSAAAIPQPPRHAELFTAAAAMTPLLRTSQASTRCILSWGLHWEGLKSVLSSGTDSRKGSNEYGAGW